MRWHCSCEGLAKIGTMLSPTPVPPSRQTLTNDASIERSGDPPRAYPSLGPLFRKRAMNPDMALKRPLALICDGPRFFSTIERVNAPERGKKADKQGPLASRRPPQTSSSYEPGFQPDGGIACPRAGRAADVLETLSACCRIALTMSVHQAKLGSFGRAAASINDFHRLTRLSDPDAVHETERKPQSARRHAATEGRCRRFGRIDNPVLRLSTTKRPPLANGTRLTEAMRCSSRPGTAAGVDALSPFDEPVSATGDS